MSNEFTSFFDYFVGNTSPLSLIVVAVIFALVAVLMIFLVPVLTKYIFPKFGYLKYANYLPFKKVEDDNTLVLTNGSVVRVYTIEGVQTSMQDTETKEKFLDLRTQLFNQFRDPSVVLRFYMVRDALHDNLDYEFDQPVLQSIYNKWRGQGLKIFKNRYFVVLTVGGIDARGKMDTYANYLESILAAYKPKLMRNNSRENMGVFLGRILSPVSKPMPKTADQNIANLVTADEVEFLKNGLVRYSSGDKEMYAAMMSFKTAPDYLEEEFYDTVSTIQTELITLNAFRIMGMADVEKTIKQRRTTADATVDSTEEQIYTAEAIMDENVAGNQNMVNYYPLFVLFGKSIDELDVHVAEFKKICATFGITPVIESFAARVSWFAQIPGFDVFPRTFKLMSKTAAISIPLSSQPTGIANCDWGDGPLVVFPTAQGTPYQFQFHVSDKPAAVGHTLTIGPTGGGKTTLFSFLIAQSLRHPKLKAFFFDRNKGAEIFTLAAGGKYITMHGKEKDEDKLEYNFSTRLNPLKMPDTAANRKFLNQWFAIISEQTDVLSADEIARAVSVNFDYLSDKDKLLKNLWESCFSSAGKMRGALKKWIDPLQYGDMFNEDMDTLDLQSRLTTFDFKDILQDKTLAPAVISYILHRINTITVSGGNPSLIMIDETAPMLENAMFRSNFIAGLQEGRKNRQAYMVAFQQANVLDKLGIGDVVRGQAQTRLFFRNPAADARDYEHWNLNPLEMAFIQGKAYPNLKRAVLLSRPVNGESVILNTELGGLGNMLRLFESGRSSVLLAEELYRMYGTNFVAEYLKRQSGVN